MYLSRSETRGSQGCVVPDRPQGQYNGSRLELEWGQIRCTQPGDLMLTRRGLVSTVHDVSKVKEDLVMRTEGTNQFVMYL